MVQYHRLENPMIKKRHFFIVIGILLTGLIIGSFLDLQINQALFSKNNAFGLIMASFAVYPCYAGLAFIGGGLLSTTVKRKNMPLWLKIVSFALSVIALGMAVYLCAREWPSSNGFNNKNLLIPSIAIAFVVMAGVYFLAYKVCLKGDPKQLWVALIIMLVIFALALLPTGFVVKLILHRPRYRYMVRCDVTEFRNWWETCKNYKEYFGQTVDGFVIDKEEFKSFPSGHSGTAAIMMMFLPYASIFFNKLKGKEVLLYYIGFTWTLLMMFSRMLVGAHFLSDTCMGSLIVVVVFFVIHLFVTNKGWIYQEQYHPASLNNEEISK